MSNDFKIIEGTREIDRYNLGTTSDEQANGFEGYVKVNNENAVYDPSFKIQDSEQFTVQEKIALLKQKLEGLRNYIGQSFMYISNKKGHVGKTKDGLDNLYLRVDLSVDNALVEVNLFNPKTKTSVSKVYDLLTIISLNEAEKLQEVFTIDYDLMYQKSIEEIYSENTIVTI